MEEKHAPGPWVADPHNAGDIQDSLGREIGSVYQAANIGEDWNITGDIPWSEEIMVANARLIAAAPEMLEILKAIQSHNAYELDGWHHDAIDAAIAKATQP